MDARFFLFEDRYISMPQSTSHLKSESMNILYWLNRLVRHDIKKFHFVCFTISHREKIVNLTKQQVYL